MASSQVEIASSAPFYCVLNRRDRCGIESNTARTAFKKNLKDLVHNISNSSPPPQSPSQRGEINSQNANANVWVRNHQMKDLVAVHHRVNDEKDGEEMILSPDSRRHAQVLGRWARAREKVTTNSRQQRENSPTQPQSSVEIPNLGGVSSLVQRWRDFAEARVNEKEGNAGRNNYSYNSNTTTTTTSLGGSSYPETGASFVVELVVPPPGPPSETCDSVDERFDTPSVVTEDSFFDWESDRTAPSGPPSVQGGNSDAGGESERLRVADVIRKLTSDNQMQRSPMSMSWKNDHHERDQQQQLAFGNESLPDLRTLSDQQLEQQQQQRCFSPLISSPRVRGRQAFSDLLMQLERDRHKELDGLVERRAVSRFSHRGRIQALLRLRFLRREAAVGSAQQHSNLMPVGVQQHSLREAVAVVAATATEQQHLGCEATIRAQQPPHSVIVGPQQHSCQESRTVEAPKQLNQIAEIGPQQHSCHEETVRNQKQSYSKATRFRQSSQSEAAIIDRQSTESTPSESMPRRQGSAVVLLREKFDVQVEYDAASPKPPCGALSLNNNLDVNTSASYQLREEPHHTKINTPELQNGSTFSKQSSLSCAVEVVHKGASPISATILEGTSNKACNLGFQLFSDRLTAISNGWQAIANAEEQEANNQAPIAKIEEVGSEWKGHEASNQQSVGTDHDWGSDSSRAWSEWDGQEADYQPIIETNCDWICDISRPKSDWEGLRQARYQEMLDSYLGNQDIRQLLERRSVSSFLSSNLRETMDQLMISRVESLPLSVRNQQEEQGLQSSLERQLLMSRIRSQAHTMDNNQQEDHDQEDKEEEDADADEEEEDSEDKEDDEEESPIRRQHGDVGDYVDQGSAGVSSWNPDGDHEVSDDFDQVASPSSQQLLSSHNSYRETRPSSSFTHRSHQIEVLELIYDLRAHMEQLHHEMSELRKSIKSCMNMQVKLQQRSKVAAAVSRSVRGMRKGSLNGAPRKGGCCVCYKMQVDSLLYRCGHMCTCFKCALELQWSSGKCPICRAPIMDVVRAYDTDHS